MNNRITGIARKVLYGLVLIGSAAFAIMLVRDYSLRQQVTHDMVLIPAGEFTMGLTREQYHEIQDWEKDPLMRHVHPGRIVWLDDYYISLGGGASGGDGTFTKPCNWAANNTDQTMYRATAVGEE